MTTISNIRFPAAMEWSNSCFSAFHSYSICSDETQTLSSLSILMLSVSVALIWTLFLKLRMHSCHFIESVPESPLIPGTSIGGKLKAYFMSFCENLHPWLSVYITVSCTS